MGYQCPNQRLAEIFKIMQRKSGRYNSNIEYRIISSIPDDEMNLLDCYNEKGGLRFLAEEIKGIGTTTAARLEVIAKYYDKIESDFSYMENLALSREFELAGCSEYFKKLKIDDKTPNNFLYHKGRKRKKAGPAD